MIIVRSNSVKEVVENFDEATSNYSDHKSSWKMISSVHSPAVIASKTKHAVTNTASEVSCQNCAIKILTSSNNNGWL